MGRDKALELVVKTTEEIGGQFDAAQSATLVVNRRPHALLVVTDLTQPSEAILAWVTEFCERLEDLWRQKKRGNRIQSMILILNKSDKCTPDAIDHLKTQLGQILKTELHESRGGIAGAIPVVSSVLVKTPRGTSSADMVITRMARSLAT
jgi:hypothetical protein